jgi:hypothetical protein
MMSLSEEQAQNILEILIQPEICWICMIWLPMLLRGGARTALYKTLDGTLTDRRRLLTVSMETSAAIGAKWHGANMS